MPISHEEPLDVETDVSLVTLDEVTTNGNTTANDIEVGDVTSDGLVTGATGHFGGVSHYSDFEADGTLHFTGDATVYDDIIIPGTALGTGATAPDLEVVFASGAVKQYCFNGASTTPIEQVYGSFEMPHDWYEGTAISIHVHWMPTTADSGKVVWQLEYTWIDVNGTFAGPLIIETSPVSGGGTAWVHKLTAFPSLTVANKIGSVIAFRFFRDPGHGSDDYEHDACLLSLGVHYQIDTCGSRGVTTK